MSWNPIDSSLEDTIKFVIMEEENKQLLPGKDATIQAVEENPKMEVSSPKVTSLTTIEANKAKTQIKRLQRVPYGMGTKKTKARNLRKARRRQELARLTVIQICLYIHLEWVSDLD